LSQSPSIDNLYIYYNHNYGNNSMIQFVLEKRAVKMVVHMSKDAKYISFVNQKMEQAKQSPV